MSGHAGAFHRMSKKWHPDKNRENEGAEKVFHVVREARAHACARFIADE